MRSKTLCCSKKIVLASYTITVLLTLATALGVFLSDRDMSPMATLAGLAWVETGVCNGFYFWKARAENRVKLSNAMVKELADKYGIEAVIGLVGITIKD